MVRALFTAIVTALMVTAAAAQAADAPKNYTIDPAHTRVMYFVSHLGLSKFAGTFNDISGTIAFSPNDARVARADITINTKSLTMGNTALDASLQGPGYFNTVQFPTAHFVSTSISKTSVNEGKMTGDLTLLGVTRPVTLNVRFNHLGYNKYDKANAVGFSARGRLNRSDFGMKTLLPDVGDQVDLRIEVEAVQNGK